MDSTHREDGPSSSTPSTTRSTTMASFPTTSTTNGLLSPTRTGSRKEKRNPSITPRRFGRFFTPRSNLTDLPTSRRILGTLESSSTNRQPLSPQSIFSDPLASDPISPSSPTRRFAQDDDENESRKRSTLGEDGPSPKRRNILADMPPPPLNLPTPSTQAADHGPSPTSPPAPTNKVVEQGLSELRKQTLSEFFKASRGTARAAKGKPTMDTSKAVPNIPKAVISVEGYRPQPIKKFINTGFAAQLLDREHGFSSYTGRQHLAFPAADYRIETASFYTKEEDSHAMVTYEGDASTIPFSLASCHGAPMAAIGDEEGYVRFLDMDEDKISMHFPVHDNAIMALDFSEDDLRLATACGDRTAKVVDVTTQTVAFELHGGHWDSLRQISFQPGQLDVISTSDRAGCIQVWDLRCSNAPVQAFSSWGPDEGPMEIRDPGLDPIHGKTVNTLSWAHERTTGGNTTGASVTAIKWMPAGREHLLLSASEANAQIKLWDTRYIKPVRQARETPLAITLAPPTHGYRSYGITSLSLSSDAARLYAVCKDSTVYAYSTAHLMLGHAPELVDNALKRRPRGQEGIGPLYGFRHESFAVRSFYVKSAIRPAGNTHSSELLAVGSSNSCAVLFPTDERYLRATAGGRAHLVDPPDASGSFGSSFSSSATASNSASSSSAAGGFPIFRSGTALIRAHEREVTTLTWCSDGKLVTASDDYTVRQWQEDAEAARYLRQVGEFGGERHMSGWADVDPDFDAEDDDEDDE